MFHPVIGRFNFKAGSLWSRFHFRDEGRRWIRYTAWPDRTRHRQRRVQNCCPVGIAPMARWCILQSQWYCLLLSFVLGCGGTDRPVTRVVGPPPERAVQTRTRRWTVPAATTWQKAVWVHGAAELTVESATGGVVTALFRRDSEEEVQARTVLRPAHPQTWTVPGDRSRALEIKLTFEGAGGGLDVCLADHEAPLLPSVASQWGRFADRSLILIVADALHAEHLGCYGATRATSPNLDGLAQQGVLFERAYSQTSWTVPSITSLFTGRDQEQHGVRALGLALGAAPVTLAEMFQAAGYRTAAFIQNGIVGAHSGLDRGFDLFTEWTGDERDRLQPDVIEFLRHPGDEPFFLYVHYLPPHEPYTPPEPFLTRFGPGPGDGIDGSPPSIHRLNQKQPGPEDPDVVRMASLYDGHVAYFDSLLGEIVAVIQSENLASRVALVQTADHGEAFGQHRFIGHNLHVYEEMVRIPLVVWAPESDLTAGKPDFVAGHFARRRSESRRVVCFAVGHP